MANITCPAGHVFSDGEFPSPYAWTLISEKNMEKVFDEIINLTKLGEDVDVRAASIVAAHGEHTYICPECGRILVFRDGLDKPATSYKKE